MASDSSVRIIFFEQSIGCETCAPTRRVLEEIVEENPDIALDVLNLVLDKEKAAEYGVDRVPAIIITAPGCDRIRYYGAPLGNELPTLLQAINMAATGETALTEQSRAQLKALSKPVRPAGVLHADVRVLSSDDLARQSGRDRKPARHGRGHRRDRVSRSRPALQGERRAEDRHQRHDENFWARLRKTRSSPPSLAMAGIRDLGLGIRSVVVALFVCFSAAAYAQAPVSYHVSFPEAQHHRMQVEVTFPDVPPGTLEVMMSRTSPGRYAIHEFARNVYDVQIDDGAGGPLGVERPNPSQWNVTAHRGTVRVRYKVFGDLLNGTHLAIDATHAHLNIPPSLMWARGLEARAARVTFDAPAQWKVATQLHPTRRSADVYRRQPAVSGRQPDRAERVHAAHLQRRSRVSCGAASRRQRRRCRPVCGGPSEDRARGARRVRRAARLRGAIHVHLGFSAVGRFRRDGAPQQHHPDRARAPAHRRRAAWRAEHCGARVLP